VPGERAAHFVPVTGGYAVALEEEQVTTLEAYADTIIPGEKRFPDDHAIAGVSEGGGSVAAGALELLEDQASGVAAGLPYLADAVNQHARNYAQEHGIELNPELPAFVALSYEDRAEIIAMLTKPGHPERDGWILLAQFCSMAYDIAPHRHTIEALEEGHPGLTALGLSKPDPDGLWRFKDFSYGRQLANIRPDTTPSGSPV
jgi:enediyne biosynthesis protein E8